MESGKGNWDPEDTEKIPIAVKVCRRVVTTLERMLEQNEDVTKEQLEDLLEKARRAVEVSEQAMSSKPTGSSSAILPPRKRSDPELRAEPTAGWKPYRNIIIAAVLALLAGGVYWFSAGLQQDTASLQLSVTPSVARLTLDGRQIGERVRGIPPGSYTLKAELEGYLTHEQRIGLKKGDTKKLSIELRPIAGPLTIVFRPPDASVKLDGKVIEGESPVTLEGLDPLRKHELLVERADFETVSKTLVLEPGQQRTVNVYLKENEFTLEVESNPQGAEIRIDGAPAGHTPKVIKGLRATRSYSLSLSYPDFDTFDTEIDCGGNEKVEVKVELEKAGSAEQDKKKERTPGRKEQAGEASKIEKEGGVEGAPVCKKMVAPGKAHLSISRASGWAYVYIDGKRVRTTPLLNYGISAGQHSVELRDNEGKTVKQWCIKLEDGQSEKLVHDR